MKLDVRLSSVNKLERRLALDGTREPATSKTVQELLEALRNGTPIHVFDVGANVGYYALLEAHVLGDQGTIYAIEAEPGNAERLSENVRLNGYSQIDVRQVAAGAERSTQELAVRDSSNIHKMTELMDEQTIQRAIEVDVYPLDMIISEENIPDDEPILIRMDIEGYEHRAFQGLTRTLSSNRPLYVMVELHDREHDPKDLIVRMLANHGFTPEFVSPDGGATIKKIDTFDGVPTDGNIHLFAGRDISIR